MKKIEEIIGNLQKTQDELLGVVREAIEANEESIISLVFDTQLYLRGEDGFGNKLEPEYADSTVRRKKLVNAPTDRVTLFDEGIFRESAYINYGPDTFEVITSDYIEGILKWRYGEAILRISDGHIEEIKERFVNPAVNNYLSSKF